MFIVSPTTDSTIPVIQKDCAFTKYFDFITDVYKDKEYEKNQFIHKEKTFFTLCTKLKLPNETIETPFKQSIKLIFAEVI